MGACSVYRPQIGDEVTLGDEPDCLIPAGVYIVSAVNPDGSFRVGGNTAVWPHRVTAFTRNHS